MPTPKEIKKLLKDNNSNFDISKIPEKKLKEIIKRRKDYAKNPRLFIQDLENYLGSVNKKNKNDINVGITEIFLTSLFFQVSLGIKDKYLKTKQSILRDYKLPLEIKPEEENLITEYANSKRLWDSYAGLDKELSKKVNTIINTSFDGTQFNSNKARKLLLSEIPKLTKHRVNTIIRTEFGNIQNISAEQTYRELDPENTGLYILAGPVDNRTAESTMEVHRQQGRGLPLDDLKELVKDVAMKYHPKTYDPMRPWIIHINTRRRLLKVA